MLLSIKHSNLSNMDMLQCLDEVPEEIRVPFACLLVQVKHFRSARGIDIYVARYEQDEYAIKILSALKANFESTICLEVTYLKKLEHRNIARYFGLDFSRKLTWLPMSNETEFTRINYFLTVRYYPGTDLSHWAKEHQQSSPNHRYLQRFLHDLLHGLYYLHSHELRIIHCDIKPANLVFYSLEKPVVIIDFDGVAFNNQLKTENVTTAFTPWYASPELLLGMVQDLTPGKVAEIGGKIDVWGVGCVAIQLCTGAPPIIRKYINGALGAPLEAFHHVTLNLTQDAARLELPHLDKTVDWNQRLIDFISQCLVFDPHSRKSAEQLLDHEYITTPYCAL